VDLGALSPDAAALTGWLHGLAARGRLAWAARGAALGAGAGAFVALGGFPWSGLALPLVGAAVAARRAPGPAELARRADALGGFGEAVRCAWDHRGRSGPVLAAQARVALRQARTLPDRALVPRPSIVWSLGVLLWLWPALRTPSGPSGEAGAEAPRDPTAAQSAAPAPAGVSGLASAAPAIAPSAAPELARAGRARASSPPELPGVGAGAPGEPGENPGQVAGIGMRAGELSAGAARSTSAAPVGAGLERALAVARGVGRLADAAGTDATAGRLPTTRDDALTDPARPFPTTDAPLIATYFDRRARRAATAPPPAARP
jgi:hypothetical protein